MCAEEMGGGRHRPGGSERELKAGSGVDGSN